MIWATGMVSEDSPWNEAGWDLDALRRGQFLEAVFTTGLVGTVGGAIVAGAMFMAFTRRRVPRALRVASWGFLGACMGLLAAVGVLMLPWTAPYMTVLPDGSGGRGFALIILMVGLPGLAIGSLVGIGIGLVQARSRSR